MKKELQALREELENLQREQKRLAEKVIAVGQRLDQLAGRPPQREKEDPRGTDYVLPAGGKKLPEGARIPPPPDATGSPDLESKIGGIWLNRAGVLIFIIGAAFFLTYAFDRGWINETARIVTGALVALIMLALGERNRRRGFHLYGQGLTGGGIALLYFSIFAAFYYYELISPSAGMALLILVTMGGVALSVYQEARAVAVLGLVTGFLNPFLFMSGEPRFLLLFSYLVLLNLGIVAVSCFKRWTFIGVISFIFTHLFMIWALVSRLNEPAFKPSPLVYQLFLTFFLLLFLLLPLFLNTARRRPLDQAGIFLLVAGAAFYYGLSYFNLSPDYPGWISWFTLALAGFYLLAGFSLERRPFRDLRASFTALALAAVLLVIYVPLQFDGPWVITGWTVQAVLLCYLAQRLADPRIHFGFWLLSTLAFLGLVSTQWQFHVVPADYRFLSGRDALLTYLLVVALLFCAWLFYRYGAVKREELFNQINILVGAAGLLFLIFCSMDIHRYGAIQVLVTGDPAYKNLAMLGISIFWTVFAAACAAVGFVRKLPFLRYAAIALFGATVIKVFLIDLGFLELVYRIVSLVVLGLIMLAVSYLYQYFRSDSGAAKP